MIFKMVLFNSSVEIKEVAILFHLLRKFIIGPLSGMNGVQMAKYQSSNPGGHPYCSFITLTEATTL
jgi:hypothetical protein